MESILSSIKNLLGISEDDHSFDQELRIHINSVFSILNQLGVGPDEPFILDDETHTWNEFIGKNKRIEMVKSYVYLKVLLIFDPPQSSSRVDSIKRQIDEYEWRLTNDIVDDETTDVPIEDITDGDEVKY